MKSPKMVYGLVLIFFLLAGCSTTGSIRDSVLEAVESGDLKEVKSQLAIYSGGRHMRDENGKSLLHLAAEYGHADIVNYLLEEGMNPDTTDRIGDTALQIAAYNGYHAIAEQLIKAGANVNAVNSYGISPLQNALFNEKYEIARLLVLNGANVNTKDRYGSPPLHTAVKNGNQEFVKFLIGHGADIHASGQFSAKAIHIASEYGHLDLVKYLVSEGADVNVKDTYGRTPLHEAIQKGNFGVIKFLVQKGANYRARDLQGNTPLTLARKSPNRDIEYFITGLVMNKGKNKTVTTEPTGDYSAGRRFKMAGSASAVSEQEIDFGLYHALVIGNNDYHHLPKLQTAKSDADDVARILQTHYGFRVELLLDADRSRIILALNKLRAKLTPGDNLLIYYAGHGWLDKDGDEGYWLPIDAQPDNTLNWVSNSSITTVLRAMKAKHVLIVADSCYSGKLARGIHKVKRSPDYSDLRRAGHDGGDFIFIRKR